MGAGGPGAIAFSAHHAVPKPLDQAGIDAVVRAFAAAASRAFAGGFDFIEIHAADRYLLNEFLSPLANQRTDSYGGAFQNRARLIFQVVGAVCAAWTDRLPLPTRISARDWVESGWTLDDP